MISKRKRKANSKPSALDLRRIRAGLMMHGHTLMSFARENQVSRPLLMQLIEGKRPGRKGRSAVLRRKLEEIAA